jgi:hypothetical protein
VALAAIEQVILERAMHRCRAALSAAQVHTVHYARFCADSVGVLKEVIEFCNLRWSARFESAIQRVSLHSTDEQWRSSLTKHQQTVLLRTFERAQATAE